MTAGPPGTPAIVAIQLCFSGSRSEGEQYVQNIGSWSEDRCLFQDFSERSFSRQQLAVEEVLRDGSGRKWYIKSDMLSSLDDDIIEKTCDRFPGVPDGCSRFSSSSQSYADVQLGYSNTLAEELSQISRIRAYPPPTEIHSLQ